MRFLSLSLGVLWVLGVCIGAFALNRHRFQAGAPAGKQLNFVENRTGKSRLLVFLHPECPCSRAVLAELDKIEAVAQGRVSTEFYFFRPYSRPSSWCRTGLWNSASKLPHARCYEDLDGRTAQIYGARTSGQVLLYARGGQLQFSGGITDGRGHEGDNDGENAIIDYLRTGSASLSHAPVYGCSIQ